MNKARLLIVEDEVIVASDIEIRLNRLGYAVVGSAARGDEAVALTESLRPDLILMDIRLEGAMDGIDTAAQIQTRFRLPVVFLTAHSDESTLERAKVLIPYGYIHKPFQDRDLEITIAMALYKHQSEEALRSSDERLRLAQRAAGIGIFDVDLRADHATWSPEEETIFGFAPGEYDHTSSAFWGLLHPEDREKVREMAEQAIKNQSEFNTEYRFYRHDNKELRWALVRGKAIVDGEGRPARMLGVNIDITERKRSDEALHRNEARQRAMIANISDVIAIIDCNGINRYKSPNIEKWFGWSPEDLVGRNTWDYIHPEDLKISQEIFDEVLNEPGAMRSGECRYLCKDGSYKWMEYTACNLVHNPDIQGILLNYHDISERKQAADEKAKLQALLQQAQKMESVGRLAGGVAHDFNNMLGVILGHVEMALEDTAPGLPLHEDLQEIRKAAQRSADLTRQLLAFARKQTVRPKILDLNDTITGMLKMLQRLIGENIQLAWQPGRNLRPIKIDPSQIDQILANLVVNARDAIDKAGRVTIETSPVSFDDTFIQTHADCLPGDYVMLAVNDTGKGMNKEIQSHLFEPFFTTKGVGEGTGLGLATVYGIVKQNGGLISVYSEPGRGATFKIYLPLAEISDASDAVAVDKRSMRGTETILLVEDEEQILNLSRRILQKHGYTVLAVRLPSEALQAVRQHSAPIHLLLTDVVMPGMNGRELREQLSLFTPGMRCLFMSGYTADIIAHHGVLEEGLEFLQKPFSGNTLLTKVREVLDRIQVSD